MILTISAYFPIVLLIFLMTKKNSMPSNIALPLTAFVTYLIVWFIFNQNVTLIHATVLQGFLLAWTPILIIACAIFLFKTMEITGGLATLKLWLNGISENKIAQLMIVGWAFPFLIEGASGFGTPAAIAAPILVGLGYPPVRMAILVLIMNSVPVSFGAVGTPTWFGFSGIDLSTTELLQIGIKTATVNSIAALVIPALALLFVVKPRSVFQNMPYILLSVLFTVVPYFLVAQVNYEFPSLVGGFTGIIASVILAKYGVGLSKTELEVLTPVAKSNIYHEHQAVEQQKPTLKQLLKASFPIWGTMLLLIVTRIPQLGIKQLLTSNHHHLSINLGYLGEFTLSPALVVSLKNIFNTSVNWTHSILYVPSILPFIAISFLAFIWFKTNSKTISNAFKETALQMKKPTLALLGTLIFVGLMMMGDEKSPVNLIGLNLAELTGSSWKYVASLLGALGTFFSGSNTISNLTFGAIQDSIAGNLGLNRTTILALQSVGGAMGNMICINNIVAVASVLALNNMEGYILKRTVRVLLVYAAIAAMVAVFLN
jgi:lactate permease